MKGSDILWVIGDIFVGDSIHHHLLRKHDSFIADNYQTTAYAADSFTTLDPSAAGRLRNSLVTAMNQARYAPKLITVVIENDVTKNIRHGKDVHMTESLLPRIYTNISRWLVREFN